MGEIGVGCHEMHARIAVEFADLAEQTAVQLARSSRATRWHRTRWRSFRKMLDQLLHELILVRHHLQVAQRPRRFTSGRITQKIWRSVGSPFRMLQNSLLHRSTRTSPHRARRRAETGFALYEKMLSIQTRHSLPRGMSSEMKTSICPCDAVSMTFFIVRAMRPYSGSVTDKDRCKSHLRALPGFHPGSPRSTHAGAQIATRMDLAQTGGSVKQITQSRLNCMVRATIRSPQRSPALSGLR